MADQEPTLIEQAERDNPEAMAKARAWVQARAARRVFGPYQAQCVAIHDGDTLTFNIDLGFDHIMMGQDFDGRTRLSCRVYGINAPELDTPQGKDALAYAQTLIQPGDLCMVTSHGWDAYGGRFDGTIQLFDGRDFGTEMVNSGHAVVYLP